MYWTELNQTELNCIELNCIELHWAELFWTELNYSTELGCISQKHRKLKLIVKTITQIILDLRTVSENHRNFRTWKSS